MPFAVTPETRQPASSDSTPAKDNRPFYIAISILAVIGILLSAVSLQRHYAKSESKFCDFATKFNCDIVNRSEFSSVMGIPVAGIGLVGYAVLLVLATMYRTRPAAPNLLLALALAGLVFALYLTYIEGLVLDVWCILCLSSLASITAIAVLTAIVKTRTR